MPNSSPIGIAVALGSGLAVGIQATLFLLMGRTVGPFRASMIFHLTAGIIGALLMLGMLIIQGREQLNFVGSTIGYAVISVLLGVCILMGVAFAYQRTGVAAGIATVFMGQMIIGIIVDTVGLSGDEPISLDLRRVIGVAVMIIAIVLLVPRR